MDRGAVKTNASQATKANKKKAKHNHANAAGYKPNYKRVHGYTRTFLETAVRIIDCLRPLAVIRNTDKFDDIYELATNGSSKALFNLQPKMIYSYLYRMEKFYSDLEHALIYYNSYVTADLVKCRLLYVKIDAEFRGLDSSRTHFNVYHINWFIANKKMEPPFAKNRRAEQAAIEENAMEVAMVEDAAIEDIEADGAEE